MVCPDPLAPHATMLPSDLSPRLYPSPAETAMKPVLDPGTEHWP